jgi:hypothetical protein
VVDGAANLSRSPRLASLASLRGAAVKTDSNTDYSKMRVKQLRQILGERGVECIGCVEKADFIAKIKETEALHTEL